MPERRGGREPRQLVGVFEEGVHTVADQAHGRLVSGRDEPRSCRMDTVLSMSFGFGGQNAVLVFQAV